MADRSIKVYLRAEISDFKRQMDDATKAAKQVGKGAEETATQADTALGRMVQSATTHRESWDEVGKSLMGVGLATGAVVGIAVARYAEFDAAMSGVAATGGATADELDKLRAAAIAAGADTKYSATEAANGIEEMAKAGVSATDILNGGLNGALSLAAAGSIEVADAAAIASTVMNQFGLTGRDVGHIADVLAASAGKANGEVADFGLAMKYVGPVAAQLGVSLEETSGTLALLAQNGLLADSAGTGLRGVIMSLTAPTKAAQLELEKYNISAFDSQDNFVGLASLAGQLQTQLGGLTEAERSAALGRMFGNEQITTARILYAQGADAIEHWTEQVDDQGYAAEVAATKMDNLKGDLEGLSGSLETLMIGAGEGADGPLRALVQGADSLVDSLAGLPPWVQQAGLGLGALIAVTSLLAGGFLLTFPRIIETGKALRDLGVISPPAATKLGSIAGSLVKIGGTALAVGATAAATGILVDALTRGDAVPKANAIAKAVNDLANGGNLEDLNSNFDNFGTVLGASRSSVTDLGSAMDQVFKRDVTDTIASWTGAIPGVTAYTELAEERFTNLDRVMSGMVQSGAVDNVREALGLIYAEAESRGISVEDIKTKFSETEDALIGVDEAAKAAEEGVAGVGDAAAVATPPVEEMSEAMAKFLEGVGGAAGGFLDWSKGLDEAKYSLGGWLAELEAQAGALEGWSANLVRLGERGISQGLMEKLAALGPAGAKAVQDLANGTDEEIARAEAAFQRGVDATNGLQASLEGLYAPPPIVVDVDTSAASIEAQILAGELHVFGESVSPWEITANRESAAIEAQILAGELYVFGQSVSPWELRADPSRAEATARGTVNAFGQMVPDPFKLNADPFNANRTTNAWLNTPRGTSVSVDADVSPAERAVGRAIAAIRSMTAVIPGIPGGFTGGQVGGIAGFAAGGQVPGTPPSDPTRDNVFAMTERGRPLMVRSKEWIQPQPAVEYYGAGVMRAMQYRQIPKSVLAGFAAGGSPSAPQYAYAGATQAPIAAPTLDLTGLQLVGTLDLGNGLEARMEAVAVRSIRTSQARRAG
ncbi:phage tail tape measure protein [Oerskovia paurometabola]|uniref:Phage tail tape measure protein n=1 Tax=Oerskovia paurometabola TaxID=162170 RepID=A0ABW1XA47_9CELL|nr:phage tail tape measure protein [Oerskovia paurometabola]MBM7497812.1 TP901 family phage tail tape measure protein [Oerskovia paurometabola]